MTRARGPRRVPALARALLSLALAAVASASASPARAAAASPPPAFAGNVVNADNWAAHPPGRERDRILSRWAAGATLPELMYVLRRGRDELGPVETELVERALERATGSRAALRRRLVARLAAADPSRARRRAAALVDALREPPFAPEASVFRAALLAPARGAYEDFARALRAGFEAGLARGAGDEFPVEARAWDTGDHDPGRAAAAIDSAVRASAVLVGELLSAPTIAAATAARVAGTPLVSPTATDESIGGIGPAVFAIGPSNWDRGVRLAAAHDLRGARVGVLVSNASAPAFARGFVAAAQKAGAAIAWEATYSAGATAFRGESKAIGEQKLDVLFWDGEPREADALLRQLAKDRVAVRVSGGGALAPELVHADARFLLEGVHYVADEWALPEAEQAWLDAWARERTSEAAGPLHVRGFLAGRLVRDAVRSGALCPEEVAAWLDQRRHAEPHLREHGFVDFGVPGTTLPVHVVRRGKATRVPSGN